MLSTTRHTVAQRSCTRSSRTAAVRPQAVPKTIEQASSAVLAAGVAFSLALGPLVQPAAAGVALFGNPAAIREQEAAIAEQLQIMEKALEQQQQQKKAPDTIVGKATTGAAKAKLT